MRAGVVRLPMPPSNNHYKRHYCTKRVNKNGSHIVKAYITPNAEAFKLQARVAANRVFKRPLSGDVRVACYVHSPRNRRPDLDNIPKVALDALQGIAFENDSQIVEICTRWVEDVERLLLISVTTMKGTNE